MKFSLIVATLGRSTELVRLFDSLVVQTHRDFEVIVVDQNDDNRTKPIVEQYINRLNIHHLISAKGLSRARNIGLMSATGDVIAFPDDDCWYPPTTLELIANQFDLDDRLGGITGRSVDKDGLSSQGRWAKQSVLVNKFNIWVCATSYTIFLRASVVARVGRFDETLGVGASTQWGAGEEVNFLLQCLKYGAVVRYNPKLCIRHPEPVAEFDERALTRTRLYNRGYGRVLSLNHFPFYFVVYSIARPALGSILSILKFDFPRARYYSLAASERFFGWRDK